jgi:hypothetical protein
MSFPSQTSQSISFQTQYYLAMYYLTGGTVSPSSEWVNSGSSVTITATPTTGYSFSSWSGTGTGSYSGSSSSYTITVENSITETASFQLTVSYQIWDETTGATATVGQSGTGAASITVNVGDSMADKPAPGTSVAPGSSITIFWNGVAIYTTTANSQGYWEVDGTISASQAGTTNTAYIDITPPGGTSTPSAVITIIVNTPPPAPTISGYNVYADGIEWAGGVSTLSSAESLANDLGAGAYVVAVYTNGAMVTVYTVP